MQPSHGYALLALLLLTLLNGFFTLAETALNTVHHARRLPQELARPLGGLGPLAARLDELLQPGVADGVQRDLGQREKAVEQSQEKQSQQGVTVGGVHRRSIEVNAPGRYGKSRRRS